MARFCSRLMFRALIHDNTKYYPSEAVGFSSIIDRLRQTTYGSPQYKKCLEDIRPAIQTHYSRNSHHPENHADGVHDMDLADLIEMYCDWHASAKRHDDGNIFRSIRINQSRFGLSEQLASIMENEARTGKDDRRKIVRMPSSPKKPIRPAGNRAS
jgi:hypothetical protein